MNSGMSTQNVKILSYNYIVDLLFDKMLLNVLYMHQRIFGKSLVKKHNTSGTEKKLLVVQLETGSNNCAWLKQRNIKKIKKRGIKT